MRKRTAKIIEEKINILILKHKWLEKAYFSNAWEEILECLASCQEIVIDVDVFLEEESDIVDDIVKMMENYCELLYQLTLCQQDKTSWNEQYLFLKNEFDLFSKKISMLELKKEIVFFPYNAAMWDCMESVWEAAISDPDFNVSVVPIPYFEKNSSGEFVSVKYDINSFPKNVDVIDYTKYSIDENQPDIAYIHNPFDQFNNVTSIHPDYYSYVLKNKVGILVYIPYFLSLDYMPYSHRELPSYFYVDYVIVPSIDSISYFSSKIPKGKLLPLGSPIVDRIIRLQKQQNEFPDEWKIQMAENDLIFNGQKLLFFNTSITSLLKDKDYFLSKIKYLIKVFERFEDFIVVWRPHPLIKATLKRMGLVYENKYEELEKEFLQKKIGILDKGPDVGLTVALCDAYIGEDSSSIVTMFEVAGKPVFLNSLNVSIFDLKELEIWIVKNSDDKSNEYFYIVKYQLFCRKELVTGNIYVLFENRDLENFIDPEKFSIYVYQNKIYMYKSGDKGIYIFDMAKDMLSKIYNQKLQVGFISNESVLKDTMDFSKDIGITEDYRAKRIYNDSFGSGKIHEDESHSIFDFLCYTRFKDLHNIKEVQSDNLKKLGYRYSNFGVEIHSELKKRLKG